MLRYNLTRTSAIMLVYNKIVTAILLTSIFALLVTQARQGSSATTLSVFCVISAMLIAIEYMIFTIPDNIYLEEDLIRIKSKIKQTTISISDITAIVAVGKSTITAYSLLGLFSSQSTMVIHKDGHCVLPLQFFEFSELIKTLLIKNVNIQISDSLKPTPKI